MSACQNTHTFVRVFIFYLFVFLKSKREHPHKSTWTSEPRMCSFTLLQHRELVLVLGWTWEFACGPHPPTFLLKMDLAQVS